MTKTNKGALIFARNNAQIDYIKQARFSAQRIRKHLDIPTSIVTDSVCLLYTSPSPRDRYISRMPSSA